MVKIQHIQTEEIRDISRHSWINESEYISLRRFWKVLDEGDPVKLFHKDTNGEWMDNGLIDRDHAIRIIKNDSANWYLEEVDMRSDESKLIDQVLRDANKNTYVSPSRDMAEDYEKALYKAVSEELMKRDSKDSYVLASEGNRAIELGGYDKWKKAKEEEKQPRPSIQITGGNNVVGNHNTGNTQGRDFLKSESPAIKNSPQQAQPEQNPIKKSDHAIWDKIKHIATIIGGLGAVAALAGKLLDWW